MVHQYLAVVWSHPDLTSLASTSYGLLREAITSPVWEGKEDGSLGISGGHGQREVTRGHWLWSWEASLGARARLHNRSGWDQENQVRLGT